MEIRQIKYFLAVAHHGHFTRAATELNIAQPALSRQIRQLELQLGTVLFDRTKHQVILTPAGEAFLPSAENIVKDVEEALSHMQQFKGELSGRVRFGLWLTLGLGPLKILSLLSDFRSRFPNVQVLIAESNAAQLMQRLLTDEIDLALLDVELLEKGQDIEIEQITREAFVVMVGPNHRLAGVGKAETERIRQRKLHYLERCKRQQMAAATNTSLLQSRIYSEFCI